MSSSKTITVPMRRYFTITKSSSEPINPENIQVQIQPGGTARPGPNLTALAILWAHFQAGEQGLLNEGESAPWERFQLAVVGAESGAELQRWIGFLHHMITDAQWTTWMTDPQQVRLRAVQAYTRIEHDGSQHP